MDSQINSGYFWIKGISTSMKKTNITGVDNMSNVEDVELARKIIERCSVSSKQSFSKLLAKELCKSHPSQQQYFWNSVKSVAKWYFAEVKFMDGRNQKAVHFTRDIVEL